MKKSCAICDAEFGIKFRKMVCGNCRLTYCKGHIIEERFITIHNLTDTPKDIKDGICYNCLFNIWGKNENKPKGVTGRVRGLFSYVLDKTNRTLKREVQKTKLVLINNSAFEQINSNRAWSIFRNQKDVPYDFIIQDMAAFARVVSVSKGRENEKDITFTDLYKLMEWLKTHPFIPGWAKNVSWSDIESSHLAIDYVLDVWHIVSAAVAISNPASGLPWAIYHISDRAVDHEGKGLVASVYDKVKNRFNINANPKKAMVAYIAGSFILRLYGASEES